MYLRRCIIFFSHPSPITTSYGQISIMKCPQQSKTNDATDLTIFYYSIRSTSHHHPFLKLCACLKFNFETPLSTQMPTRHVSFPNPSISYIFNLYFSYLNAIYGTICTRYRGCTIVSKKQACNAFLCLHINQKLKLQLS